jgi:hypothetical protein
MVMKRQPEMIKVIDKLMQMVCRIRQADVVPQY